MQNIWNFQHQTDCIAHDRLVQPLFLQHVSWIVLVHVQSNNKFTKIIISNSWLGVNVVQRHVSFVEQLAMAVLIVQKMKLQRLFLLQLVKLVGLDVIDVEQW